MTPAGPACKREAEQWHFRNLEGRDHITRAINETVSVFFFLPWTELPSQKVSSCEGPSSNGRKKRPRAAPKEDELSQQRMTRKRFRQRKLTISRRCFMAHDGRPSCSRTFQLHVNRRERRRRNAFGAIYLLQQIDISPAEQRGSATISSPLVLAASNGL